MNPGQKMGVRHRTNRRARIGRPALSTDLDLEQAHTPSTASNLLPMLDLEALRDALISKLAVEAETAANSASVVNIRAFLTPKVA